ncbi:MAG: hypothetical protein AAGH68_13090 [Pseudomonadota bacterium]
MFPQDSLEDMMKPGREAFEYWISFFPTAPLFGVKWRFDGMMPGMDQMMPGMDQMMPGMNAFTGPMSGFTKPKAPKAAAPKTATPKPAEPKPAATAAAPVETPAPAPKPAKAEAAPVVVKPAAKKAAEKSAKPVAAKVEKAAAKTATKTPAKAKTKGKAKDGKPGGLLAEKPAKVDDLKLIKGVGPGLERELNGLGVYQFSQMAGFSKADLTWIDDNLTAFKGRCFRDDWTGQAKSLIG